MENLIFSWRFFLHFSLTCHWSLWVVYHMVHLIFLWMKEMGGTILQNHPTIFIIIIAISKNVSLNHLSTFIFRELLFDLDIPISTVINPVHFFPAGGDRGPQPEVLQQNEYLLSLGLPVIWTLLNMNVTHYVPLVSVRKLYILFAGRLTCNFAKLAIHENLVLTN